MIADSKHFKRYACDGTARVSVCGFSKNANDILSIVNVMVDWAFSSFGIEWNTLRNKTTKMLRSHRHGEENHEKYAAIWMGIFVCLHWSVPSYQVKHLTASHPQYSRKVNEMLQVYSKCAFGCVRMFTLFAYPAIDIRTNEMSKSHSNCSDIIEKLPEINFTHRVVARVAIA